METPQTLSSEVTHLTVSVYVTSPTQGAYVFVSRWTGHEGLTKHISRHYTHVTEASLGRLAHLCDQGVSDDSGRCYPRHDGWLYVGRLPKGA